MDICQSQSHDIYICFTTPGHDFLIRWNETIFHRSDITFFLFSHSNNNRILNVNIRSLLPNWNLLKFLILHKNPHSTRSQTNKKKDSITLTNNEFPRNCSRADQVQTVIGRTRRRRPEGLALAADLALSSKTRLFTLPVGATRRQIRAAIGWSGTCRRTPATRDNASGNSASSSFVALYRAAREAGPR